MRKLLKAILRRSRMYEPIRDYRVRRGQLTARDEWERRGKPVPPPHIVKQEVLREYARKYGLHLLVETGTYYGDMVDALKNDFERIYSIELSRPLFERAQRRFRRDQHVELVHGDSGDALATVVSTLRQPALFWLDGHYSGEETARGASETPVYQELDHIFAGHVSGNVVIIDDARLFGTDPAYPTIDELQAYVLSKDTALDVCVEDDSIRITPR